MEDNEIVVSLKDLPFKASVKYLGSQPAKGLWGMKHTRKPVDYLVGMAKHASGDKAIPIVKLEINLQGLSYQDVTNKKAKSPPVMFSIDSISYGVQDLVYTRVFSMIVVTSTDITSDSIPFVCHSFVCESRNQARQITYALAAAFQEYGRQAKLEGTDRKKKFAIDLRTPEEQAEASEEETEA